MPESTTLEAPIAAPASGTINTAPEMEQTLADMSAAEESPEGAQAPEGDTSDHAKEQSRRAYEMRQKAKRADELAKELEGYKRREEDARKAKLTEEQRLREERDVAVAKAEKVEMEMRRQKIGAKYKLDQVFIDVLIGSDDAAMEAHAEEMARRLPRSRVGNTTEPGKEQTGPPTYTREQLRKDPKLAQEIFAKYRRGEVVITE